jgi:hypothetical protein
MGWGDVRYCFAMAILVILLFLSFFRQVCPTHFSEILGFHGNDILNCINTPKASTHYGGYSYKVSWSLMKGIQFFFKSPLFHFHGNCGKVCPTDSDFFGLFTWMLFLSSFINFCLASNPLWSFLCFSFCLAFWSFPCLPSKVCPTQFSKMPWSNFMKLCRIIICHVKLCL